MRIGFGYDIHVFAQGRELILGGVMLPHTVGLEGHSDADVLLHAIMDALLGSAGLGDIGTHFPNTDPEWKNVSSLDLLKIVAQKLKQKKVDIVNIDSTVVLEEPKLKEHIPQMRSRISDALGIDMDTISIKATTNEGVGFVGRKEGCAAFAVALTTTII